MGHPAHVVCLCPCCMSFCPSGFVFMANTCTPLNRAGFLFPLCGLLFLLACWRRDGSSLTVSWWKFRGASLIGSSWLKYRGELQFEQKWRVTRRGDKFIVNCYMCAFLSWKMEYQHLSLYVSTSVPDCSGFLVHNGDSANATLWQKSLIFVTTPLATLMNRKSWSLWTPGIFSKAISPHQNVCAIFYVSCGQLVTWRFQFFYSEHIRSAFLYKLAVFAKRWSGANLCALIWEN